MQGRYRSSGDGFRPGPGPRSFRGGGGGGGGGGGFNRQQPRQYSAPAPAPPMRKADIFMEAGRLAAEYLVSKGVLPPNSLPSHPGKWQKNRYQETALPERPSALSRLGSPVTDVPHGRRRYDSDDFNYPRNQPRGRRRNGPYNRGYGSGSGSDWGNGSRENGRRAAGFERGRRYSDPSYDDDEDEDDYAPGYPKVRRGGPDEVGSSISRVSSDERHSRSEAMGESETHEMADDTGSKASSPCTKKCPQVDADVEVNKATSEVKDAKALASEAGDEVKSDESGDSKSNMQDEGMEGQPQNKNKHLLRVFSFAKVPTKPRSSAAQKSPKDDQVPAGQTSNNTHEVMSTGVSEVTAGEDTGKGSLNSLDANPTGKSEPQSPDISSTLPEQPTEESVNPENVSHESLPGFGTSAAVVDVTQDDSLSHQNDEMEGIEVGVGSSPPEASIEIGQSLQNLEQEGANQYVQISSDEEMVEAVDHEKQTDYDAALFPKVEQDFDDKIEGEKQLLPTSFDLNLMGTPELAEIPHDPTLANTHGSAPVLEKGKEIAVDVGLSIGNSNNNTTDDYSRLSGDDKVVPVINLEDESPMEDSVCDPSKLKNETIYSNLDNFLSQTDHAGLPGIQDGFTLGFPEFGTETAVVTGVDDSIYGSLGEIPISFMEVWDPPPHQEYGKFF